MQNPNFLQFRQKKLNRIKNSLDELCQGKVEYLIQHLILFCENHGPGHESMDKIRRCNDCIRIEIAADKYKNFID